MSLKINDNFNERAVVYSDKLDWTASPMPNVYRKMLDRIGDEVARATTIVRYEPNSEFSSHLHTGGEEFLVLDGVFSDEHNDYPKGTYVRNPIGTQHTPKIGAEGAVIFVKLQQFSHKDTSQKVINTTKEPWLPGLVDGLSVMPLHEHEHEHVVWLDGRQTLPLTLINIGVVKRY